jgi:hypothetical protein
MIHYKLHGQERVIGFTDVYEFDHTDSADLDPNSTVSTYQLPDLPAGTYVDGTQLLEIVEGFASAEFTTLAARFIMTGVGGAFEGAAVADATIENYGVLPANATAAASSSSATPFLAFTAGEGETVEDLTAGKLRLWLKISHRNDRQCNG